MCKDDKKFPENPQIGASAEQAAAAAKKIDEFLSHMLFLKELLMMGTCSPSSVDTHLSLARYNYDDLAQMLGAPAHLDGKLNEVTAMLREANGRIRDLEQSMGEAVPPEAAIEGYKAVCNAFESWYALSGFDYASCQYGPHGITADFSDELSLEKSAQSRVFGYHGDKELKFAVSDYVPLLDQASIDARVDGTRMELLDTDGNRRYIREVFAAAFPGSRICKFSSIRDGEDYLLKFEAFVGYQDVINWKRGLLKRAKADGRARTGRVYREYLDACSKLESREWKRYADPKTIEKTEAEKQKSAGLIGEYEALAAGSDTEKLQAWLTENSLDAAADFEGTLYATA